MFELKKAMHIFCFSREPKMTFLHFCRERLSEVATARTLKPCRYYVWENENENENWVKLLFSDMFSPWSSSSSFRVNSNLSRKLVLNDGDSGRTQNFCLEQLRTFINFINSDWFIEFQMLKSRYALKMEVFIQFRYNIKRSELPWDYNGSPLGPATSWKSIYYQFKIRVNETFQFIGFVWF